MTRIFATHDDGASDAPVTPQIVTPAAASQRRITQVDVTIRDSSYAARVVASVIPIAIAWSIAACGDSNGRVDPRPDAPDVRDGPNAPDASIPSRTCTKQVGCSFGPATTDPRDPIQIQLGCGPAFGYESRDPANPWLGTGSFCPDSPDARRVLHDNRKLGYLPGYCETCMGVPADQIFVFWGQLNGPNCPSSCGPQPL